MTLSIEKCIQAWTNSFKEMKAQADIVFFGDSLVYYGEFAPLFPDKVVCNLGLRGDSIKGMIDRIDQIRILNPDRVFLMAGINDVACLSEGEFKILYSRLLDTIIHTIPKVTLVVQSILPVNTQHFSISCNNAQIVVFNRIIELIVKERGQLFLDLYSLYAENGQLPSSLTTDGIHLKSEAYEKWYDYIRLFSLEHCSKREC